jgi:hypothetical protein
MSNAGPPPRKPQEPIDPRLVMSLELHFNPHPHPAPTRKLEPGFLYMEGAQKADHGAEYRRAHKRLCAERDAGKWPPVEPVETRIAHRAPFGFDLDVLDAEEEFYRLAEDSDGPEEDIDAAKEGFDRSAMISEEQLLPVPPLRKYAPVSFFDINPPSIEDDEEKHAVSMLCGVSPEFLDAEFTYLWQLREWAEDLFTIIPKWSQSLSDNEKELYLEEANHLRDEVIAGMARLPIINRSDWRATSPYGKAMALARLHELIYKTLKFVQDGEKRRQIPPVPPIDVLDQPCLERLVVDCMKDLEENKRFGIDRYVEAEEIITRIQKEKNNPRITCFWEEARIFCRKLQRPELAEYRQFWSPIVELHLNLKVETVANLYPEEVMIRVSNQSVSQRSAKTPPSTN